MVAKVGPGDASYDISLHPLEMYGRHPEHPLTEILEAFPDYDRNSLCPADLFTTCSAGVQFSPSRIDAPFSCIARTFWLLVLAAILFLEGYPLETTVHEIMFTTVPNNTKN